MHVNKQGKFVTTDAIQSNGQFILWYSSCLVVWLVATSSLCNVLYLPWGTVATFLGLVCSSQIGTLVAYITALLTW